MAGATQFQFITFNPRRNERKDEKSTHTEERFNQMTGR